MSTKGHNSAPPDKNSLFNVGDPLNEACTAHVRGQTTNIAEFTIRDLRKPRRLEGIGTNIYKWCPRVVGSQTNAVRDRGRPGGLLVPVGMPRGHDTRQTLVSPRQRSE